MAQLEITLTKEKFDALSEELKTFYTPNKEGGYELEGIGSIQRALAEEKAKKSTKPELLTEIEELRKFKAEQEAAQQEAQNKDLEAKGKYEEALKAKEAAWNERFEREKAEKESFLTAIKRERLTNELVKRGALADRAGYLVGELDAEMELIADNGSFTLKKKGGIGDADEFDAVIESAKQKTPFFFASNGTSGSGASGSQSTFGTGKTMARAAFSQLAPADQMAFSKDGGTLTD